MKYSYIKSDAKDAAPPEGEAAHPMLEVLSPSRDV